MFDFKLNAKLVKVAMMFQAKLDPRWYLNGFFVDSDCIVATNGHVMWFHEFKEKLTLEASQIIRIIGIVPAKASDLHFKQSSETSGFITCSDSFGKVLGALYFEILEGKYPDWKKASQRGEPAAVQMIGFNAEYLHLIQRAAKVFEPRFKTVRVHFHGQDGSVKFEMPSPEFESTAIVMPTRV